MSSIGLTPGAVSEIPLYSKKKEIDLMSIFSPQKHIWIQSTKTMHIIN
jgi:hypothetical protein